MGSNIQVGMRKKKGGKPSKKQRTNIRNRQPRKNNITCNYIHIKVRIQKLITWGGKRGIKIKIKYVTIMTDGGKKTPSQCKTNVHS